MVKNSQNITCAFTQETCHKKKRRSVAWFENELSKQLFNLFLQIFLNIYFSIHKNNKSKGKTK